MVRRGKGIGNFALDKDTLLMMLDRPIVVHRVLVSVAGSFSAAGFLGQAIYWTGKGADPDGWFYKTQVEWEEETGISPENQLASRIHLRKLGVLEESKAFIHGKLHYRVNFDRLAELITAVKNGQKQPRQRDSRVPYKTKTETETSEEGEAESTIRLSGKYKPAKRKVQTGIPDSTNRLNGKTLTESPSESPSENTKNLESETLNVADGSNFVDLKDKLMLGSVPDFIAQQAIRQVQEIRDFGSERRHIQLLSICYQNDAMDIANEAWSQLRARKNDEARLGPLEKPGRYYDSTIRRMLADRDIHVPRKAETKEWLSEMRDELGLPADADMEQVRAAIRRNMMGEDGLDEGDTP